MEQYLFQAHESFHSKMRVILDRIKGERCKVQHKELSFNRRRVS
jgi:hypothetical protein